MAVRRALVLVTGEQKELPTGDTLAGAADVFQATAEGAIAAGAPVAMKDSATPGNPRAAEADANGAGTLRNAVGIAPSAITDTNSGDVQVGGEVAVPDARWDVLPATTDVGKIAYLSGNVGKLTLTAPSTSGDTVLKMGLISRGGTGAVKMIVQIGQASTVA